jgi:cell division protein FtsI (penicillin-binding protein 3)
VGFQLKGEGVPYFKKPGNANWYGTTLPWMSIGYELKITPLQTLMLYNAVANHGKMVKPMIVQSISRGNKIKENFKTEVIRNQIASDKTIKSLQSLLEGVVENGTATNIKNADYQIAGKTGTAQKLVNGRYTQKYYASFAGYFPADRPKYSAIIVIDSPKGFNAYGGDVSAPVFKEIADKIYAQDLQLNEVKELKVPAKDEVISKGGFPYIQAGMADELQLICNTFGLSNHYNGEERWVKSSVANLSISWKPNKVEIQKVPDVRGMTLKDALYVLENKGLNVQYTGRGRVKNQSIAAGSPLPKNGVIKVILGQ